MNKYISTKKLLNEQYASMSVIKIVSIPDMRALMVDEKNDENNILEKQKRNFQSLLSEISHIASKTRERISAEIMWVTEPTENQIYSADISLYILTRCISKEEISSIKQVERVSREIITNLSFQRYHVESISVESIENKLRDIDDEKTNAIVKKIRREHLGTNILDECYSYDIFPADIIELEEIVYIMSQYPKCVFSVQIIPTSFSESETKCIENTTQALSILSHGANMETIKVLSISKADKLFQTYRYYDERKKGELFNYNILVTGNRDAVDDITSKIIGYLQRGDSNVGIKRETLSREYVNYKTNLFPLPWAASSSISNLEESNSNSKIVKRLPQIASAEEMADIFKLPFGSKNISAGVAINYADTTIRKYKNDIINKGDLSLGTLKNSLGNQIGIRLNDLTKHALVVGTPGSGKTTLLVGLLNELYKNHSIPFLVIEPAKNEYRSLISKIKDLQVFTPGKNSISPFIINPFIPPKNVRLEAYKSVLKTAFSASISMEPPLDQILFETIDNCYAKYGWLDDYSPGDGGEIFNIDDFIECFEETFEEIGYRGDATNIGRAGIVRLKTLSRLFKNYNSIPIEDILNKPTVIELSAIENDEEKALIIALVLLSILTYVNANVISKGDLRNVILLEEAHVLLDNNVETISNAGSIAQRLIKRMLAELRSAGMGMIIADQSPNKVTNDVIALTDIKVAFRIVEKNDRNIIENSINLSEYKSERLSGFAPGEAFVFFNKLDVAEEVEFTDYREKNKIEITISDEELKEYSTYWKYRQQELKPYPYCKLMKNCAESCNYHIRLLANNIAEKICKKYITGQNDVKDILTIFQNIDVLLEKELVHEKNSNQLKSCVRIHIARCLRYKYKFKIAQTTRKLLERYGGENVQ